MTKKTVRITIATVLLVGLVVGVLFYQPPPPVIPPPPPVQTTGAVHLTTAYDYLTASSMKVGWQSEMYMNSLEYALGSDSHIKFTVAALGSTTNPVQTFGVGYDTAAGMTPPKAVNVSGIGASSVALTLTDTVGATDFTVFYFPSTQTISSVTADIGGSSTNIPSSSFVSYAALSTCTAPCAYDSGSYVEVKAVYEVPTVLTFGFA